jgi:hypothetical protein
MERTEEDGEDGEVVPLTSVFSVLSAFCVVREGAA